MLALSDERDRGANEALQMVLIVPFVALLGVLVYSLGNNVDAQAQVRSAAESAAQAGVVDGRANAANRAEAVARDLLNANGSCGTIDVDAQVIDPGAGDSADTGVQQARRRAYLRVDVACTVDANGTEEVALLEVNVSPTYRVSAVSFFDEYRSE